MKITSNRVEDLKRYAEECQRLSLESKDPIQARHWADVSKSCFEMLELVVTYGFCEHT